MSKGNMLLGQARGKVGDVVFSRAYGQQITRSKATSVANPKTYGQNVQRSILATVAKAAAAMTPIIDHSFANIKYGGDSTRHFRKINMERIRSMYMEGGMDGDFNLVAKGGSFLPGMYIVSDGNLPKFTCVPTDGLNPIFIQGPGRFTDDADVTVADFKNAYPYIQGGDQLTLVTITKQSGSFRNGNAVCVFNYDRIVFAPNAFDNNSDVLFGGAEFKEDFLDMTKTTNPKMLTIIGDPNTAALGFTRGTDDPVVACALILSRMVNGKWQRSAQYITMLEQDDYADNEAAIDSYSASESILQATEYLNQATEGSASAGISGAYMQVTGSGENAPSGQAVDVGDTAALGDIEIVSGKDLSLAFAAYGTEDNPLIALDLTGTSTDGPMSIKGKVKNNAASLNFNVGEDGNLVGTYSVTAVYRSGRAVANFTLSTGA